MPKTFDIRVDITGDSKSLERAFSRSTKSAQQFQSNFQRSLGRVDKASGALRGGLLRGGATAFVGGAAASAALDQLNRAVDAASAQQEQLNKSRVVLGQASKTVEAFGETSAKAFGISKRQALEAAGAFGGLFTTVGVGQQKSADLAVTLTRLAGDLSSFFDASTSETLDALRSGLIGEAEPLRRFNVLLSEATVQQEAFRQTGKSSASALTEQEKILARFTLIMRQTTQAQGDAARTSETLAARQRQASAALEDSRAKIGRLALPLKTQLVGALTQAAESAELLAVGLEQLGKIKIPPIKIPIVGEFGGGSLGGIIDDVFIFSNPALAIAKLETELARKLGIIGGDSVKAAAGAAAPATGSGGAHNRGLGQLARQQDGIEKTLALIDSLIAGAQEEADKTVKIGEQRIELEKAAEEARKAAERSANAFAGLMDSLSLGLEKAQATARLNDDLQELRKIETALEQRIEAEGRTTALARQLFQTRQQIADVRQRQRDALDFRTLGLGPTGDELVPGVKDLRKQLGRFEEAFKGTFLDTGKTRSMVKAIRLILSREMATISEEMRATIDRLLDDLDDRLKDGAETSSTPFRKARVSKLFGGIGLSPDELRAVRAQASVIGRGGTVPTGGSAAFGVGLGDVSVTAPIVVQVDGQTLAKVTVTQAARIASTNSGSRRGTRAGKNRGVG